MLLLLAFEAGLLIAASMAVKRPGRREFPQLVSHHIFGYEYRDEFFSVMNGKRETDKLGNNGGSS